MQKARETEPKTQKIPAGKRGFFHAGIVETGSVPWGDPPSDGGGVEQPGGRPAAAAPGQRTGGGVCRRLGCPVRYPAPVRAGADAGLGRGLLCLLRGRCGAGDPAPQLRGAFAPQHLPALRGGSGGGRAVVLAETDASGVCGRLRNAGTGRAVFFRGGRRGTRPLLRGRRAAGRSHGGGAAPLPAGEAGVWVAAGLRVLCCGTGRRFAGGVFARGGRLRCCGAGTLLPRTRPGGTGICRGDGGGSGRGRLRVGVCCRSRASEWERGRAAPFKVESSSRRPPSRCR